MKHVLHQSILNTGQSTSADGIYPLKEASHIEDYAYDTLNDLLDIHHMETLDLIDYIHKTWRVNA